MILKKNDFQTVQEWNQAYIDKFIGQENEFFPNKKKNRAHLQHLYFIRFIGQLRNIILCCKGRL